jgi:hypothetical protein
MQVPAPIPGKERESNLAALTHGSCFYFYFYNIGKILKSLQNLTIRLICLLSCGVCVLQKASKTGDILFLKIFLLIQRV